MTNEKILKGYVTSCDFGGLKVPVPLQSLALRDYCQRKRFVYKLHSNESIKPNSYVVLDGLIDTLEDSDGIVMCSMFMLPSNNNHRVLILNKIIQSRKEVHFVLENLFLNHKDHINLVEDIVNFKNAIESKIWEVNKNNMTIHLKNLNDYF